jgi:hypothetical protein
VWIREVELGKVFCENLCFLLPIIIPPMFHTYLSSADGKIGISEVMMTEMMIIILMIMIILDVTTPLVTDYIALSDWITANN